MYLKIIKPNKTVTAICDCEDTILFYLDHKEGIIFDECFERVSEKQKQIISNHPVVQNLKDKSFFN